MANNKWEYDGSKGAIVDTTTGDIVLYKDDTSVDAIIDVVALYNSGSSVADIETALKGDARVTDEEAEFVSEQIGSYVKLVASVPVEIEGDILEPKNPLSQVADKIIETAAEKVKVKKTRATTKTIHSVPGNGKKVSAEDAIQKLKDQQEAIQEKMSLIEIVHQFEAPEAPENMSKSARDIWMRFSKKHNDLIGEFINEIQSM